MLTFRAAVRMNKYRNSLALARIIAGAVIGFVNKRRYLEIIKTFITDQRRTNECAGIESSDLTLRVLYKI